MNKELVVFTNDFPYGRWETFLETEVIYLAKEFDRVIFVSENLQASLTRDLPANCEATRLNLNVSFFVKLQSVLGLFSPMVWREFNVIRKTYSRRLSLEILKTILISKGRARIVKDHILKGAYNFDKTVFYSYWCNDMALGIALAHSYNNSVNGVCRIHRWDVYFEESEINYLPFRHFIADHLQKIYSISQDGIDYAVERWKVDRSHFALSRLGIDNEHGPVQPKNDSVFRVVSCSNIIPVKRVGLIAEALKEITEHTVEWTHIGDGPLKGELEEKVKLLPKNILVNLVGRLPNREVYKMYEKLCPDLFINVSRSEGVPVSIMEAMSYGIPVLATDVGGNDEIVNKENGVLFSKDLPIKDITHVILKFISQEDDLALGAFKTWNQNYSARINYPRFALKIRTIQSNTYMTYETETDTIFK